MKNEASWLSVSFSPICAAVLRCAVRFTVRVIRNQKLVSAFVFMF